MDRVTLIPVASRRRNAYLAAGDGDEAVAEWEGYTGQFKREGVDADAAETDSDRVFVAGRRRSPAGKAVFGSTAQAVLLEAPCPVTYVRHESAD